MLARLGMARHGTACPIRSRNVLSIMSIVLFLFYRIKPMTNISLTRAVYQLTPLKTANVSHS